MASKTPSYFLTEQIRHFEGFAVLATRAEIGQGGRIRTCEHLFPKQARLAAAEHPVLQNSIREKDSNLYFLVQSQASCRLDDPEMLAGKAGLEPAIIGVKDRLLDALHSSPQ